MTRQFMKLAHSLYECKYHVVFCPKYRYKILQEEVAKYIIRNLKTQNDLLTTWGGGRLNLKWLTV